MGVGIVFNVDDPICDGGYRVVTQMHRRGAGVICLSGEDEFCASLADKCLDDSKRKIFTFKHRPLFYMELEIGEDIVGQDCCGELFRIKAVSLNRLTNGDVVSIGKDECLSTKFTYQGEASEKGLAEPNALLFRKADDFNGKSKVVIL